MKTDSSCYIYKGKEVIYDYFIKTVKEKKCMYNIKMYQHNMC